jgi:hypothetical protein
LSKRATTGVKKIVVGHRIGVMTLYLQFDARTSAEHVPVRLGVQPEHRELERRVNREYAGPKA